PRQPRRNIPTRPDTKSAIAGGSGITPTTPTATPEIWPPMFAVPLLVICKRSVVPRSINDGNVMVLNPLPKFMLLASETNTPLPLSIEKSKKDEELLVWPVTSIDSISPGMEGKLNVAVPVAFGAKLIREPPAMKEAPPVSTAVLKSTVTVAERAGETATRERAITAALSAPALKGKRFIVGSER